MGGRGAEKNGCEGCVAQNWKRYSINAMCLLKRAIVRTIRSIRPYIRWVILLNDRIILHPLGDDRPAAQDKG
jgi:hypothetical protein